MSSLDSEDDDNELKQAIALSLQESQSAGSQPLAMGAETIDLISDTEDDDEDEDLRQAIALSLQDVESMTRPNNPAAQPSHPANPTLTTLNANDATTIIAPTTKQTGILGLDRKAMEQERLARLGKRKRNSSGEGPLKQIMRTEPPKDLPPASAAVISPETKALQYPRGAIKRTFATKYPRTDDISLDEVLEASNVNIAVISSFMWDSEWLYKKLDPMKVKQVWIMNAKDQETQQRWIHEMQESGVPNLKVHFPPMGGMIHCMHSKFMLLFGKEKLRFVVPTANMTQVDWGEVANNWQPAVMENSVFLIDLPRRADGIVGDKNELTRFGRELIRFLEAQKVGQNIIDGVLKFDFSETKHIALVHSIAGSHDSSSNHLTGLPGLSKAIQDLKLDHVKDMEMDYVASSLGAINDNTLRRLYIAARGERFTDDANSIGVQDKMRIYFPTLETVEKSVGGSDCGGIITLAKKHFGATSFPQKCLRDYESNRRGMLSHNKLLFVRGCKHDGTRFAWVYVGSANLSESAWGSQKVLKSNKLSSLNIKNWECGIVMPVPKGQLEGAQLDDRGIPPMSVFEGTIEIPFVFPGAEYAGRRPWFFKAGDAGVQHTS